MYIIVPLCLFGVTLALPQRGHRFREHDVTTLEQLNPNLNLEPPQRRRGFSIHRFAAPEELSSNPSVALPQQEHGVSGDHDFLAPEELPNPILALHQQEHDVSGDHDFVTPEELRPNPILALHQQEHDVSGDHDFVTPEELRPNPILALHQQDHGISDHDVTTPEELNEIREKNRRDRVSQIVKNDVEPPVEGSFKYDFEADNGIVVSQEGSPGFSGQSNVVGSYSFPLPDGSFVEVTYVADAFGFRAESPLIPTPPPMPPHALEQIRLAEQLRSQRIASE